MILPHATIGMLGGGQLGRMFTTAAHALGYKVIVLEPDPHSPAGLVADLHLQTAYNDPDALQTLIKLCDVVTTEFENIPVQVLNELEQHLPVHPNAHSIQIAQDRIAEKAFIRSCDLSPVPYHIIKKRADIEQHNIPFPAVLKTARFGYDGKGQIKVHTQDATKQAFATLKQVGCVLEQYIDLKTEISVILGRNIHGESQCFPIAENRHQQGILDLTLVPANIHIKMAQLAQTAAKRMADKLNYCGILAVEFFISRQGKLYVNEIAPRTHNSGHYSLDACITSQFEQQVRMVCDLPFGNTSLLSPVVMVNLLGDIWKHKAPKWEKIFQHSATKLHLYGKKEARIGRKMGHFCTLHADIKQAEQIALQIKQTL